MLYLVRTPGFIVPLLSGKAPHLHILDDALVTPPAWHSSTSLPLPRHSANVAHHHTMPRTATTWTFSDAFLVPNTTYFLSSSPPSPSLDVTPSPPLSLHSSPPLSLQPPRPPPSLTPPPLPPHRASILASPWWLKSSSSHATAPASHHPSPYAAPAPQRWGDDILPDPEQLASAVKRPYVPPSSRVFDSYTHALSPPRPWAWGGGGGGGERGGGRGGGGRNSQQVAGGFKEEQHHPAEAMDSVSAALGLFRIAKVMLEDEERLQKAEEEEPNHYHNQQHDGAGGGPDGMYTTVTSVPAFRKLSEHSPNLTHLISHFEGFTHSPDDKEGFATEGLRLASPPLTRSPVTSAMGTVTLQQMQDWQRTHPAGNGRIAPYRAPTSDSSVVDDGHHNDGGVDYGHDGGVGYGHSALPSLEEEARRITASLLEEDARRRGKGGAQSFSKSLPTELLSSSPRQPQSSHSQPLSTSHTPHRDLPRDVAHHSTASSHQPLYRHDVPNRQRHPVADRAAVEQARYAWYAPAQMDDRISGPDRPSHSGSDHFSGPDRPSEWNAHSASYAPETTGRPERTRLGSPAEVTLEAGLLRAANLQQQLRSEPEADRAGESNDVEHSGREGRRRQEEYAESSLETPAWRHSKPSRPHSGQAHYPSPPSRSPRIPEAETMSRGPAPYAVHEPQPGAGVHFLRQLEGVRSQDQSPPPPRPPQVGRGSQPFGPGPFPKFPTDVGCEVPPSRTQHVEAIGGQPGALHVWGDAAAASVRDNRHYAMGWRVSPSSRQIPWRGDYYEGEEVYYGERSASPLADSGGYEVGGRAEGDRGEGGRGDEELVKRGKLLVIKDRIETLRSDIKAKQEELKLKRAEGGEEELKGFFASAR